MTTLPSCSRVMAAVTRASFPTTSADTFYQLQGTSLGLRGLSFTADRVIAHRIIGAVTTTEQRLIGTAPCRTPNAATASSETSALLSTERLGHRVKRATRRPLNARRAQPPRTRAEDVTSNAIPPRTASEYGTKHRRPRGATNLIGGQSAVGSRQP
jgi:hypothetical protein